MKILLLLLLLSLKIGSSFGQVSDKKASSTYVFVHGAWSNSLLFKSVDSLLRSNGNTVYRPTLTGLGERRHLASPTIDLTTHIRDIVNTIRLEDLHEVILVGHSYGGMVISGVVDQLPDRIKQLVYIDAFVPNNGESLLTSENISKASKASLLASIQGDYIRMPIRSIKTEERQPLKTFTEKIKLTNPTVATVPATYILMVAAGTQPTQADFYPAAQRAIKRGWSVMYEEGHHADLLAKPVYLAQLLAQIQAAKR